MKTTDGSLLSRRELLRRLGAGLALAGLAGLGVRGRAAPKPDAMSDLPPPDTGPALSPWQLPKLPYAYDALEPFIDARTMQLHHDKHHAAYLTNAKHLLEPRPDLLARTPKFLLQHLAMVPGGIRDAVRDQVGGHFNHSFFWTILGPGMPKEPVNTLADAITQQFGSFAAFKANFTEAAMKRFGSGWAWLVVKEGRLQVASTANQDSPVTDGANPVIGLDVWEHAYYLRYQNLRADYVAAFWNIVNWPQAESYYQAAMSG